MTLEFDGEMIITDGVKWSRGLVMHYKLIFWKQRKNTFKQRLCSLIFHIQGPIFLFISLFCYMVRLMEVHVLAVHYQNIQHQSAFSAEFVQWHKCAGMSNMSIPFPHLLMIFSQVAAWDYAHHLSINILVPPSTMAKNRFNLMAHCRRNYLS